MNEYLKKKWTEKEILLLPSGEHDYFDRKSGQFLNKPDFRIELAKHLSAFSNSGGGHLIIGVEDNGNIDGVEKILKGRQKTREWLEQIIPNLLNYPLRDFRIHEVIPAKSSKIPKGKTIIVIDIGDSKLAPHQSAETKMYHFRSGGHSEKAGHHYISLIFGRSRFPNESVATSWIDKVINPLLDYLEQESSQLKKKVRFWHYDKNDYFYRSATPILNKIIENKDICDIDNFEQFVEFMPSIRKLLEKHDNFVNQIDEELFDLFEQIKRLPIIMKTFNDLTSPNNLQKLFSEEYKFKDCKPSDILLKIFPEEGEKTLDIIARLMANRRNRISDSFVYYPFWSKEGDRFISFLKYPPLSHFDQKIDNTYILCDNTNKEIINTLKKKRNDLSIEYGIPVR